MTRVTQLLILRPPAFLVKHCNAGKVWDEAATDIIENSPISQWNLSITETLETVKDVLITEVSSFQW